MTWNHEKFGFKIQEVFYETKESTSPQVRLVLDLFTSITEVEPEVYGFDGPNGHCSPEEAIEFLENIKKSAELAIEELRKIN